MFDGDKDGYLSESDLVGAVQKLGELQQPDADPCQGDLAAPFASFLSSVERILLLALPQQAPIRPYFACGWQSGFRVCLMLLAAAPSLIEYRV
jgi:hypothetical protein